MDQILVTVVKDSLNYYPEGCEQLINCGGLIEKGFYIALADLFDPCSGKPTFLAGQLVKSTDPVAKQAVTRIKDDVKGLLYVTDTPTSIIAECGACCITT